MEYIALLFLIIFYIKIGDKYHLVFSYNLRKMKSAYDWLKFTFFCLAISIMVLTVVYFFMDNMGTSPYVYMLLLPVTSSYLGYFYLSKFNCNAFTFSRIVPFSKTYNIHLSNPLLDQLKKIKKNNKSEKATAASEYLKDTTEKELVNEIKLCIQGTKAKCIVMTSHLIGRPKQKAQMIELLSRSELYSKEKKVLWFNKYTLSLLLSFSFKSLKPLKWEIGELYISDKPFKN